MKVLKMLEDYIATSMGPKCKFWFCWYIIKKERESRRVQDFYEGFILILSTVHLQHHNSICLFKIFTTYCESCSAVGLCAVLSLKIC
ncbi:hypothetical protein HanIR_Chr08g0374931 [Helianthus annuus]|nr:hypothetical protein HanIR_Chr08g0371601 [Helianthus annuus]KAJ0547685.1 hypothetical protein HanIR_Chr08g0374931 [Helianthus annuus]